MIYLAHKTDDKEQTLQAHSMQTAANSRDFAVAPLKDICYTIGLLHDVGKYLQDFQKRIRGQNIRVEHSVCGAQYCQILFKNAMLRLLTALCIAGHQIDFRSGTDFVKGLLLETGSCLLQLGFTGKGFYLILYMVQTFHKI